MVDFSDLDAPDTTPSSEIDLSDPPVWPKVVGIISIVFAGLGLVCGGIGALFVTFGMPAIAETTRQTMEQQGDTAPLPPGLDGVPPTTYVISVLGLLLAVLLLFAGITLISRTPVSRMLHLVYGGLGIPVTFWSIWMQVDQMMAMDAYIAEYPDGMFAQTHSPIGSIISIAIGVVLGLSYPVFCLVWFGLIKKKPSDMTGTAAGVY